MSKLKLLILLATLLLMVAVSQAIVHCGEYTDTGKLVITKE